MSPSVFHRAKSARRAAKDYTPFPPDQLPSRVDKEIESGEFFLKAKERAANKKRERAERHKAAQAARKAKRMEQFQAPADSASASGAAMEVQGAEDVDALVQRAKGRKSK